MKFENLSGGAAVGGAIAMLYTHGQESWAPEEIAVLAVGLGAAITYAVGLVERVVTKLLEKQDG